MASSESNVIRTAFKRIIESVCNQDLKDFILPEHYFSSSENLTNELSNNSKFEQTTASTMAFSDSSIIRTAFEQIIESVSDQDLKDFILPEDYFSSSENLTNELSNNAKFEQTTSIMTSSESSIIRTSFEQIIESVCDQDSKDFTLPEEYFSSYSENLSNELTNNDNSEECIEDVDKLRRAIECLLNEVRYQCVIIRDFNLPPTFVTKTFYQDETHDKISSAIPKQSIKRHKPKRTTSTRASRQKDKERKRLQRAAGSTLNSSETWTNINDSEATGSRWQRMYRNNPLYSERKKEYGRTKYHSDLSHQSHKKDFSKRKYIEKYTDSEFREQKKRASQKKYRTNIEFQTMVKNASTLKYRTSITFQNAVRHASKMKYNTNIPFQNAVKHASKMKYNTNFPFQNAKRNASKLKYKTNIPFQIAVKNASKMKYNANIPFQNAKRNASKLKYKSDIPFQNAVRNASKLKYKTNIQFQNAVRNASKLKYKTNIPFQNAVQNRSLIKYKTNLKFKAQVKAASQEKYSNNKEFQDKVKMLNLLRYRQNVLTREKYRQRLRVQYQCEIEIRKKKISLVQQKRQQDRSNLNKDAVWFRNMVREGPCYVCSVCLKFKFRKQVVECDKDNYAEKGEKSNNMANQCISYQFMTTCTAECQNKCQIPNHRLWICHSCHQHILKGELPKDANSNGLQLPPIPNELKSLNRLERQLIAQRIPFMKIVQLPKGNQRGIIGPCVSVPTDIEKTTKVLPRCEDDTLVRCKLKRKLSFKGHSQYEFVRTKKIKESLECLKEHNPLYHDVSVNPAWKDTLEDITDVQADQTDMEVEDVDGEEEQEDQNTRDRGLPSDTCLQPVDIGQEMLDQHFDDVFCVAPGEGKTPVTMMQEHGNEAMSFPVQFPTGCDGSFDHNRPERITRTRYFHARLLHADSRFSSDSAYIFYAQYLSELEQVISKVSIAMRKSSGKDTSGNIITANMLSNRDQLRKLLTTDQGYKFLTPIRGTPPYWQAALRDLMAMIRQLGIPTWFATFSAADLRWTEIMEVLLKQQNCQQAVEELDWTGRAELLKNNPVMNAVLFDHRFHTFLKEIIIKNQTIGEVKDHFHRIEFQQRGSPHAHCLFWIKDAPQIDKDDDQTVCEFIDRFVSCSIPDNTADPELHEIVGSVQQHSKKHTKSCKKKGTTCRFNFPRPPSQRTFISRQQSLTDPSIDLSPQLMMANAKAVLQRLWSVIQEESLENITTNNLLAAAGITQEEYEIASNIVTKRTNVVLQRKPSDIWINQYNPALLRCWNANMDIQYITDPYSCVMYIISYISKAEREMGVVLENARKEATEGNLNAQDTMKKIGSAYFRQREVSAQEAAYRVCGLHLKEASRKVQFVPSGENQVRMSLPLNIIQKKAGQTEDENIWMVSLYDRYKARPDGDEFENLCYASFCSQYNILSPSQLPKNLAKSNVCQLKNDLGFIRKRTRTDFAVVRYPRFSVQKKPEQHYHSILQLFLPHRTDAQLKPPIYQTYEEMYSNGNVTIRPATEPQSVMNIVNANKQMFEMNAESLDEAEQMIDLQGPMEDAWAQIAPETEAQRLECDAERATLDEEDNDLVIPELDSIGKKTRQGNDIEIRQSLYSSQQIQTMMRGLNADQMAILYKVRQWCIDKANGLNPEPFRIFINGGAGTGKSHLIKCLHHQATKILSPTANNPDDVVVLLTAPTATAAFKIGGTTLHHAFSLSKSLPLPYIYKRDDELNKLRSKLQYLNILIIDEISMVGQRMLLYVSERLRQIKQSGNALFGNICVISVGDFYQLPPVKQKTLFDLRQENFFPLWSLNFSLVSLHQIMRQKDDAPFAELLNRLRVKKKSEKLLKNDHSLLEACKEHSVPRETLHIFGTNKEVSDHNSCMIEAICETTQTIQAQDYDKDPRTSKLTLRDTPYDTSHDYLPPYLVIGQNARVMLLRNVDVSCGLVNGAMGTVTKVMPPKPGSSFPQGVLVLFDNETVGLQYNSSGSSTECQPTKITAFEENLPKNAIRHQFPLQLAWGCTVHKVQGITTDKAVVSLKNIFAAGMAYVALSRVTSINGLVIKDFDEKKIYCNEQISQALQQMPPFITPTHTTTDSDMVIMLHNIQGLYAHIEDLRSNSDTSEADVICLTETWLGKTSPAPSLEGYKFIHKPRSSSYPSREDIFQQLGSSKHGGVGIYTKQSQKCCELTMDGINMECVVSYIKEINTNVVVVYRPEKYTSSLFIEEMYQVLLTLPQENPDTSTIVLGDFNQDILKTSSHIKNFMEQQGFTQIVTHPTTDGNTLIDHVYLCGNLPVSVESVQTYYSYHNMVALKFKL